MDGDDVDEPIQIELEAADAVPALSFTRTLTQSDHSPVSAESPKSLRIPLRPLPRRQTDPSSPGPSVTSPLKRDDSSVTSGILSHRTIATIHRHAGARDEIKLVEMERRSTRGPLQLRDLFRKPLVKQFYVENKLQRSPEEQDSYKFELFFDLIFVGVLHQLADAAVQEPSGNAIGAFLLAYSAWIIWQDIRLFLNQSGTEDVIQRLYIFTSMILLVGYAANLDPILIEVSGENFDGRVQVAYRAVVVFIEIGALFKMIRCLIYGFVLPNFLVSYLLQAVTTLFSAACFLPLAFVDDIKLFIIMPCVAFAVHFLSVVIMTMLSWRVRAGTLNPRIWLPALNYEHFIARSTDFTIIVFGESVLGSTFRAGSTELGAHGEWGRAVLGIFLVFGIAWLYFSQASSRRYIHAVRRHWLAQFVWTFSHFGISAGLVIAGATIGRLVRTNRNESTDHDALRWYLGGSLAIVLAQLATIGFCHECLDEPRSSLIPRRVRIHARHAGALVNLLTPLAPGLTDSTKVLAIHTGVTVSVLVVEVFGKLGSWAHDDAGLQGHEHHEVKHIIGPSIDLL